jgi:hypothetical protein
MPTIAFDGISFRRGEAGYEQARGAAKWDPDGRFHAWLGRPDL